MPIYEYRCKSCGTLIEVIQKFDDKPLRKCRECSGRLEKLISRTSFQLKGGGWFAQGYGSGGGSGSKPTKTGSAESSKPESKSKSSDKKAND
jgi:putative FmdB family regulatory protein